MRRTIPVISLILGLFMGGLSLPTATASTAATDAAAAAAAAATASDIPSVVPRPTDWTALDGRTKLTERTRILIDPRAGSTTALPSGRSEFPGPAHQSVRQLADQLRTEIKQVTGITPRIASHTGRPAAGDIALRLTAKEASSRETSPRKTSAPRDTASTARARSASRPRPPTASTTAPARSSSSCAPRPTTTAPCPAPAPSTAPRSPSAWCTSTRAASTGRSPTWRT